MSDYMQDLIEYLIQIVDSPLNLTALISPCLQSMRVVGSLLISISDSGSEEGSISLRFLVVVRKVDKETLKLYSSSENRVAHVMRCQW